MLNNLLLAQSNGVKCMLLPVSGCCWMLLLVVNSRQKQELQQGVNLELLSQFPTHFKQSRRNVNNQLVSFRYPITAVSFLILHITRLFVHLWSNLQATESSTFLSCILDVEYILMQSAQSFFWIIRLCNQFEVKHRLSKTLVVSKFLLSKSE